MVGVAVDGQQLFCNIFVVVILRAHEDGLRLFGPVNDTATSVGWFIVNARQGQNPKNKFCYAGLKVIYLEIKRRVAGGNGRGRLVAS